MEPSSASAPALLVLERNSEALEQELIEALQNRDWVGFSQGLCGLQTGSVPTALLAGLLRLADEIGESHAVLAMLDSNLTARDLSEVLKLDAPARRKSAYFANLEQTTSSLKGRLHKAMVSGKNYSRDSYYRYCLEN
jgi:hypothetical protein